tara:strand:- start:459 stop:848 length:390 start_codon:yes stop_codon:yes gene_type:complete
MRKLLLIFGLFLAIDVFAESVIYKAGTELVSKKRTSPAVLFYYKNDLIRLLDTRVFGQYGRSSGDARNIYQIRKGDKIRLLESLRNGDIFKVQLLEEPSKGSYYFFIDSSNLKHFSLIESEPSIKTTDK